MRHVLTGACARGWTGERETCDALRLELEESKRGHQSQQQRDSKKLNDFSRYERA